MQFGSILKGTSKKTGEELLSLQLDNNTLFKLLEIIKEHGKKYLKDMKPEDIKTAQNLKAGDPKRIPRLTFYLFKPSDKAPDFIEYNVSMKVE